MKKLILALAFIVGASIGFADNATANMQCGFKPFPPIGCTVTYCQCDSSGNNCQWVIRCD